MSAVNHIRFRALLDQADALQSERLSVASTEMLAGTFCEVIMPIKTDDDPDVAFAFIDKCGPSLRGLAVFALLKAIADELCRRTENESDLN